jgi:hypothetical protein
MKGTLAMKDYSVTPRTTHKFDLGTKVFDRQNAKPCLIVGFAGLALSPSYCVQYEGDPGMDVSMPFRYIGEYDISTEEVTFSQDADEIITRLNDNYLVSNREIDFLVKSGRAIYTYDDPDSERWTGITLKDRSTADGDIYSDQAGLEEHPGRL